MAAAKVALIEAFYLHRDNIETAIDLVGVNAALDLVVTV
jgi:hypothetical protein